MKSFLSKNGLLLAGALAWWLAVAFCLAVLGNGLAGVN